MPSVQTSHDIRGQKPKESIRYTSEELSTRLWCHQSGCSSRTGTSADDRQGLGARLAIRPRNCLGVPSQHLATEDKATDNSATPWSSSDAEIRKEAGQQGNRPWPPRPHR